MVITTFFGGVDLRFDSRYGLEVVQWGRRSDAAAHAHPDTAGSDENTTRQGGGVAAHAVESGSGEVLLERPRPENAKAVWELIRASHPLDLNSPYAYLLLCHHFAGTSVVAHRDGELVGFVGAYEPPTSPAVVFVWQIAVRDSERGTGLGTRLLDEVVEGGAFRFLEATVTPSNASSWRLFRGYALKRNAHATEQPLFPSSFFPGPSHEQEVLIRIGPLQSKKGEDE